VTLVDGVATAIQAEEVRAEEVSGQLVAVYHVSIDFQPSLVLYTAEGERRIRLDAETAYLRSNREISLDDLQAGDRLQVRLVEGVAEQVVVQERPRTAQLTGTLEAVDGREITVRVSARQERKLVVAEEAVLTMSGEKIGLDALRTGDRVELKVRGDVVIELNVRRSPNGR